MKSEANSFDTIIKHVFDEYHDVFEWVFNNWTDPGQPIHEIQCVNLDTICKEELPPSEDSCDYIEIGNVVREEVVSQTVSEPLANPKEVSEKTTQTEEPFEIDITPDLSQPQLNQKRSRGRPRKYALKPKKKNVGQLWEFLLELLSNRETNPSLVRWLCRRKGTFKLIQSEKVAKKWGEKRSNPRMNYKKMSRTIRHYYKKNIMIPVYGKKLVYQFGPEVISVRINVK